MSSQLHEFPIVLSASRFDSFFSYNLCYKSERQCTKRLFIKVLYLFQSKVEFQHKRKNNNIQRVYSMTFQLFQQKMFSRDFTNFKLACVYPPQVNFKQKRWSSNVTIVHIRFLKNQFSLQWDSKLCPLPYRCDVFPAEIWSNLCTSFSLGKISSVNVKCKLEYSWGYSTVRKDSSFFFTLRGWGSWGRYILKIHLR